jgi:hypothetical protein
VAKHKDPLVEALEEGFSFTYTIPDGGDLASMRAALKHGQTITVSPVSDTAQIKVGDIVFLKWHDSYILHLVADIQDERLLIVNSLGKENGWVSVKDILGRVTDIVEPEPRPEVPLMLDRLGAAYSLLAANMLAGEETKNHFNSILTAMRWYAGRIGPERWGIQPRQNRWSYEQRLWHLLHQVKAASVSHSPSSFDYFIARGQECVGQVAEIYILFEYGELE